MPLSRDFTAVLRRVLAVDHGEWLRTGLVSAYLFLVIAGYVILKAVRDSLYLDAFGAIKLPYVIVGIAVLVGLFVDGYIRASRRVRVPRLIVLTLTVLISNLVLFWVLAQTGQPWLFPVLYIWVGCYGVIAPVQVWTMVNEVFATRQVKRLLGMIGAGGIAGAVAGGALTTALAERLGTIHMLLVVALILATCVGIVITLSPYRRAAAPQPAAAHPRNLRQAARSILGSKHLRVIGGLVWISALCTTIVDYQFKAAVSEAGFSRDQLTAFFGTTYGTFALGCLAMQLVMVRPILRRIGLGAAILVLPLSLIGGSTLLISLGTLWAATLAKAGDGVFKHSVDRSTKELAYLPVPSNLKVSVKSTIDMVLDRLGDGSGGVLLMVLATWLHLGIRPIAAINLSLLACWLVLALALRRSYLTELEQSIGQSGRLAGDDTLDDADAREALARALRSTDDREILSALDLVSLMPGADLDLDLELQRLAREGSPEVRARVFAVLLQSDGAGLPDELTSRLEGEDQELLVRALDLVLATDAHEVQERAQQLIGSAAPETRGAMLALLVRRLGPEFEPMAGRMLESLLAESSPHTVRCAAATALGLLPPDSPLVAPLGGLIADRNVGVRQHAVESAGRLRRIDLAPQIVAMLGTPRTRRAARTALLAFRAAAGPALLEALVAPRTSPNVRRRTPRLLAQLAAPEALEHVAVALTNGRAEVRNAALATLSWRRRMFPDEDASPVSREDAILGLTRQIASSQELLARWDGIAGVGDGADLGCLRTVLHERLLGDVERIFQWLELSGPPQRIRLIRAGLRNGGDRVRRENAIELLEGLLPRELKARVSSLLDRLPWEGASSRGRRAAPDVDGVLAGLAGGSDGWMAAWALNVGRRRGRLDTASHGPGPGVDEFLNEELARGRRAGEQDAEEREMATTTIDRVMALKAIDLFQAVPAEELVHLARVVNERCFSRGEPLFSEGDSPGPLYIPLDGRVALQRAGNPAGEVPAGSPIGTWSLFDEQPRTHGAVALDDLCALVVEREDFYDVLAENVEILRSLVGNLLHRLQGLTI